ncbi:hypothetical protein C7S13_6271 [Burkholderia cepacia]|nr:hypothetical protein [Burkholderia cepacia]
MVRFIIVVVEEGIRRVGRRGTVGLLNAVGMSRDYSGWRRRRNDG